jgi:hypothetical protein
MTGFFWRVGNGEHYISFCFENWGLGRHLKAANVIWDRNPTGMCSARSGFDFHMEADPMAGTESWNWVWKLKAAQKRIVFIRLAAWNRLLTNEVRYERVMIVFPLRLACSEKPGSVPHLLRDCEKAYCLVE